MVCLVPLSFPSEDLPVSASLRLCRLPVLLYSTGVLGIVDGRDLIPHRTNIVVLGMLLAMIFPLVVSVHLHPWIPPLFCLTLASPVPLF